MIRSQTLVTWVDRKDLIPHVQRLNIAMITHKDIKDKELVHEAELLIFQEGKEYKILKSRH